MATIKIGNCTECGKEIGYEDSRYYDTFKDGAYICRECGDAWHKKRMTCEDDD
jgi:hypothetical protein